MIDAGKLPYCMSACARAVTARIGCVHTCTRTCNSNLTVPEYLYDTLYFKIHNFKIHNDLVGREGGKEKFDCGLSNVIVIWIWRGLTADAEVPSMCYRRPVALEFKF